MTRARLLGVALGVVMLSGAGVAAVTTVATADAARMGSTTTGTVSGTNLSTADDSGSIDPLLQVPAGNQLVDALDVERGVQTYVCTYGAWTFLEPGATLVNGRQVAVVLHSRGPVWVSTVDGSAVTAKAVPGASVPRGNSVPELLLQATENRGNGVLGRVSYIQRLNTSGGVAPAGACTDGTQVGVP